MEGVAENLQAAKGGEVDTAVFKRVRRAVFFELLGLLGRKTDALNFERVERLANAGVDVQQINPIFGGASSQDRPGNTQKLQVGAV